MGTVTVNGKPLAQHIGEVLGSEIEEVRNSENKVRTRRPLITRGQKSSSRSDKGKVVFSVSKLPNEPMVVMGDLVYWRAAKEPFGASGESLHGAFEYVHATGKIRCHECGSWFSQLSTHIPRHHISSIEYRDKHGFNRGTKLMSPVLRDKKRDEAKISGNLMKMNNETRRKAMDSIAALRASGSFKQSATIEKLNVRGNCPKQIPAKLLELSIALGRSPSQNEASRAGICLHNVAIQFGSYNEALVRAGLVPRHKYYSHDDLLFQIRRFKQLHQRNPKKIDCELGLLPSYKAYHSRFGTMQRAIDASEEFVSSSDMMLQQHSIA